MQELSRITKKIGSVFLALCLVIAMMPVSVFAEGEEPTATAPTGLSITIPSELKKGSNNIYFFGIGSNETNTFKLGVEATPEGASNEVTWASDSVSKGITIDENGVVTIPDTITSAQYPKFTATSKVDSSIKASFNVYVVPSMTLDNPQTLEFTLPTDGTEIKKEKYFYIQPSQYGSYGLVDWSIKDDSIADIEYIGNSVCYVIPKKPGTTEVTATSKLNAKDTVTGTVVVKGVTVRAKNGDKNATMLPNESVELVATGATEEETFTWSSSDEAVATVDANGKVTTLKEGYTLITATSSNEEAKGGFKVNVKRSENSPYLTDLQITNYSTFKDWTSATSGFEPSKLTYDMVTKSGTSNTLNFSLKLGCDYTKYKVEVYKDGELKHTPQNNTTTLNTPLEPGDNKITIKVTDLANADNYTEYVFNIERIRNNVATIKSGVLALTNRALMSTPLYIGKAEGTLFRLNASTGALTNSTGVFSTTYGYKGFLHNDVDSFTFTTSATDSNSKLRVTVGDKAPVMVESTNGQVEASFGDSTSVNIKVECCSDITYYNNQKEGMEDPFVAEKTYNFEIAKSGVTNTILDAAKILSIEPSVGTWCTPGFSKDSTVAAILLPNGTTSVDLTVVAGEGATAVYKTSATAANKLEANEDGKYVVTSTISATAYSNSQKIIVEKELEDGSKLQSTYTITYYVKGKLSGMPDKIVDYLCPGSQYSNIGSYGLYPERSLTGSGSWNTPISLGNFGGYITYYYENAIKNDPKNPYGVDFTVFGNSNGGQGFSEPGNVLVSKDGKTWYTLAGSAHYDANAIWNYQLTYKRNGSGVACSYTDSLGKSDDMVAMYKYALPENYPLYNWPENGDKQITLSGTLLVNDTKDPYGSSAALFPAFGYVDVHTNSSTVAGTGENVDLLTVPVGNPYMDNYNKYGDGFDLDWAVDENGLPVELDEINYVKVQTASFIMAGAIGEKSTEVNSVTRTFGKEEAVGKTAAPTSITVGKKEITLKDGVDTYKVDFPEEFDVVVNASEDANVYINDTRCTTRTYTEAPDKGIIRIIVQEGEKEPVIYYLVQAEKVQVTFDAANGQEAVVKDVIVDTELDYTPEAPTKEGYTFVGWYKNVDDTTTAYENNATYAENVTYTAKWAHVEMLGAQGKYVKDGKSGIRFGTKIYNDGDKIVEKGTLILPANLLAKGEALTLDTPKVAKSVGKSLYEVNEDENYVTYLGTISNIPQAQFDREMTAASYVIYKDKAGNQYEVYSQYKGSTSVLKLLGNDVNWNEEW